MTEHISKKCTSCGRNKITALVSFKQNVSYLIRRQQREFSGWLCFKCMTAEFAKFELVTLVGTWWGIIGCVLGPVFIVLNLFEYISGSYTMIHAAVRMRPHAVSVDEPSKALADPLTVLGNLMERYPTALLDTTRLAAPKRKMKDIIKQVWREKPQLRGVLGHAYLHLSHFQDGIGDAVLDCKIPDSHGSNLDFDALGRQAIEMSVEVQGDNLRHWLAWSKVSLAELEILRQEWANFERSNDA